MELEEVERVDTPEYQSGEVDNSPKLFLKVSASFYPDDVEVPDNPEDLGMSADDLLNTYGEQKKPVYLCVTQIASVFENKKQGYNIVMADGDRWSTGEETAKGIRRFLDSLSIDLT